MSRAWEICGASVQGASHIKNNTPCQDCYGYFENESGKPPIVLTVADGHGGRKYFRSLTGSAMACDAAKICVNNYISVFYDKANIVKEVAENRFVSDLINIWQGLVLEHAQQNNFSESEKKLLGIQPGEEENTTIYKTLKAYGTTLLITLILEDRIINWQIGDGDIIFYSKLAGVTRPVPADEKLFGNQTTSLCGISAERDFRVAISYIKNYGEGYAPCLICLSTDGYGNSFKSEEDFFKAPADYYDLLETEGIEVVRQNLCRWLDETSRSGSGDDITLLFAWNNQSLR